MSDSDVATGGMSARRLSDHDAEAVLAGRSVEGVSPGVGEMLSTMRERATIGPGVPIAGALIEFVVDSAPAVTSIGAASSITGQRGPRRVAKKAAAAVVIVPAKILIGATMAAAAAVGGAQAFGIVDIPLLPGPEPVVVTTIPFEVVPPTISAVPATIVAPTLTTTDTPSTAPAAAAHVATGTTANDGSGRVRQSTNTDHGATRPVAPTQSIVEGTSGCDFGQATGGRLRDEANEDATDGRPDVAVNTPVLPSAPCRTGGLDRTKPSAPVDTKPSAPGDPSRATAPPSSVPVNNGAHPGGAATAPSSIPGADSGNAAGVSNGAQPDHSSTSERGADDNFGGGVSQASPPPNTGRGRTPPGD